MDNSSKQSLVAKKVEENKHLLPKNAQKVLAKKLKKYGTYYDLVNKAYNSRKLIFKLGKFVWKAL